MEGHLWIEMRILISHWWITGSWLLKFRIQILFMREGTARCLCITLEESHSLMKVSLISRKKMDPWWPHSSQNNFRDSGQRKAASRILCWYPATRLKEKIALEINKHLARTFKKGCYKSKCQSTLWLITLNLWVILILLKAMLILRALCWSRRDWTNQYLNTLNIISLMSRKVPPSVKL